MRARRAQARLRRRDARAPSVAKPSPLSEKAKARMSAPRSSCPRPDAPKRPTRDHRPIIPPSPLRPCAIAPLRHIFPPPKQKRLLRISREAFSVGRGNRASAALISRTSYALAGIGTFADAPKRDRRLPGIKGPVPPPLWIRATSIRLLWNFAPLRAPPFALGLSVAWRRLRCQGIARTESPARASPLRCATPSRGRRGWRPARRLSPLSSALSRWRRTGTSTGSGRARTRRRTCSGSCGSRAAR